MTKILDFPEAEMQTETTITIVWKDDEKDTKVICTSFGHADDRSNMLILYNENISDVPIMLVNEDVTKRVEITPIFEAEVEIEH